MAAVPTDLRPRLQHWWMTIEPGTQAIFEAIYLEAPSAVSRALSGGAWEADEPEPGLAAQLGTSVAESLAVYEAVPMVVSLDMPTVTPFHAGVGQKVTIAWTEQNNSKGDLGAYVTDIYVTDRTGDQVAAEWLSGGGLAAGATAERSWEFSGAASAGGHSVAIWMNAEGSDPGSGVPGEQGFRNCATAQFDVGGGDRAAEAQDFEAWNTAMNAFYAAQGAVGADALERLRGGVNWFAAVEWLTDAEQQQIGEVGSRLERIDAEDLQGDEVRTKLATLGGVSVQTGGMPNEDERTRVMEALQALTSG